MAGASGGLPELAAGFELCQRTNQEGLFGYDDWHLPSQAELLRVYQFSKKHPNFFPATLKSGSGHLISSRGFPHGWSSGGKAEDEDGSREESNRRGNQKKMNMRCSWYAQ